MNDLIVIPRYDDDIVIIIRSCGHSWPMAATPGRVVWHSRWSGDMWRCHVCGVFGHATDLIERQS